MKLIATRRFWSQFDSLPEHVRKLASKNYTLWEADHNHPSLEFKKLRGSSDRYSVRIGDQYRAIGQIHSDTITWVWIGSHAEYDRLTK